MIARTAVVVGSHEGGRMVCEEVALVNDCQHLKMVGSEKESMETSDG